MGLEFVATVMFLSGESSGLPVDCGESEDLILGGLRLPNLFNSMIISLISVGQWNYISIIYN